MIHLCYTKNKLNIFEFNNQINDFLSNLTSSDIVITPQINTFPIWMGKTSRIISDHIIDFEELASLDIKNICILEYGSIQADVFRKIIALKSVKSEIIGISNNIDNLLKNTLVDISHYKDIGFSNDEISVMLILKDNRPSDFVKECMDKVSRFKNSKYKEIESVSDIIKLLKY